MKSFRAMSLDARRRGVVMAMVLGTAMTSLTVQSAAAAETPEATVQAVNEISRYCTACWRNARLAPDCWNDCTQDVLARLLQRVQPEAWDCLLKIDSDERREFLRAIDTVKKRAQRARKWGLVDEDIVADRHDLTERSRASEREAVHQAAAELLSPRQQRIMQLSFEGWSVQEIADELAVGAERVSDEKYKAIRKLRAYLADSEA